MKKLVLICLASLFLISKASLADEPEKKGYEYCSEKKMKSELTLLDVKAAVLHSFDVLDYKMDLDIYNCFLTPYPKNFTGNIVITLKVDSSLNSIRLDAVNTSLQIDSITSPAVSFTHLSNNLNITLNRSYTPGETLSVKIYYQHKNVSDAAFNVSNGFVFTDAEPEGARKWFPCWDRPSDKATVDITTRTPTTVKLVSNGRLADSTNNGSQIIYRWISRDPVATYLTIITAKVNYNLDLFYWKKISNPNDSVPMRFYYNNGENPGTYKTSFLDMITTFSNLFTEHPFEKNGFATLNSQFTWGGMENQTMTSLCPNCWGLNLMSHEFAHQWFGDMITCATWADIFLNEGFATFSEALWYEHTGGYTAYKNDINSDASQYLNSNPGWPISDPNWAIVTPNTNTLFNTAITYNKGACVLHMLRYVMGDVLFFQGLKNYANSEWKYKSAKIMDFASVMTAAYGQDLSWYFNQWIYTANHPTYANNYYFSQQSANVWQVGFIAKQTQTNTGFFKMPLQIKINFTNSTDTTILVMNDVNNQLFYWDFNKQPSSVTFDPSNMIVLKTATISQVPPVPVELSSFTAEVKNSFVILRWETVTETNNKGFEVERALVKNALDGSEDGGLSFEKVAFIKGYGTSTEKRSYSHVDHIANYGRYVYRLKQIDFNGEFEYSPNVTASAGIKPASYSLTQNYPNPFNPSTVIQFEVPKTSKIKLTVYNLLGQEIAILAEGIYAEGIYEKTFNASDFSSGVYVYELKSDNLQIRKKMILQK